MSDAISTDSTRDPRWLILGVIGLAQVMVIMSLTVMNIALLSAQRALGFSTADRQWVVTAYTLAFGSLLLLGGRLVDLLGRKVTFLAGLAGFAGVSAIGGASVSFAMLITARACQGAFAALLSTIFASAVASYLTAHLAAARLIGRQALAGLALAHGYDTAFWWTAGIFAAGAIVGGALLRGGPLGQRRTPSPADDQVTTAQAKAGPAPA
jgi:MFS family permease